MSRASHGKDKRADDGNTVLKFLGRMFASSRQLSAPEAGPGRQSVNELLALAGTVARQEGLTEKAWLPVSSGRDDVASHADALRRIVYYRNKIQSGTATYEDRQEFVILKLGLLEKKMAQIKDSMFQMKEHQRNSGEDQSRDLETARENLQEMEEQLGSLRSEIKRP